MNTATTPEAPGIYKISIGPRTTYYGQSKNLRRREYNHLYHLNRGDHNNLQLQRSYNKHGSTSCTFVVLATCEVEELDTGEQALLDAYHGTPGCANVAKDVVAPLKGRVWTEEELEARALTRIRNRYTEAAAARLRASRDRKESERQKSLAATRTKREVQVTYRSGLSRAYTSVHELAETLGTSFRKIDDWITGYRRITCASGILSLSRNGTTATYVPPRSPHAPGTYRISVRYTDGSVRTFENQRGLADELGLTRKTVAKWCQGTKPISKKHGIAAITRLWP